MKIRRQYCPHCNKEVGAVGEMQTGSFAFAILFLLLLFPPLIWIPMLFSESYFEYRCPHCGEKTTKPKR